MQGIVEAASGLGFEEYLRQNVWEPAGMLRTSFDRPERVVRGRANGYLVSGSETTNYPWEDMSYKFAGGGMLSTVEDLARLGEALLQNRLMKPETLKSMWAPQLNGVQQFRGEEPPEPLRWQQALLWRVRRDESARDFVYHCGSVKGFNACLVIYVEEELIVATADNGGGLGFAPTLDIAEFFRMESTSESN